MLLKKILETLSDLRIDVRIINYRGSMLKDRFINDCLVLVVWERSCREKPLKMVGN